MTLSRLGLITSKHRDGEVKNSLIGILRSECDSTR